MALVNGGTYYLLSEEEYGILETDGDYTSFLGSFTLTNIGGVNYYCASYGSFDPMDLISLINSDSSPEPHTVELETAVYWSGYGFQFQ